MKIDYNLSPAELIANLKVKFKTCIIHHERTNYTDNMDASTFTDEERCIFVLCDLLSDQNPTYWHQVEKYLENPDYDPAREEDNN